MRRRRRIKVDREKKALRMHDIRWSTAAEDTRTGVETMTVPKSKFRGQYRQAISYYQLLVVSVSEVVRTVKGQGTSAACCLSATTGPPRRT